MKCIISLMIILQQFLFLRLYGQTFITTPHEQIKDEMN